MQEKAAERLPETVDNGAQTFGTFTYASTKRKIDVELCGKMLMVLLNRAEEIAACAKDMPYGIGSSITNEEQIQVWWEGVLIASCNYVITNTEYGTLTENYARYFEGMRKRNAFYTGPMKKQRHIFCSSAKWRAGNYNIKQEKVGTQKLVKRDMRIQE